ncbi:MAG: hypothetical protein VX733_11325 [Candidatus Latescibacterota bacterium]|nr:hypothetical protein [Candidatus Latescibacterota bacterium]
MSRSTKHLLRLLIFGAGWALSLWVPSSARAEIPASELNATRWVSQGAWLRTKLELMGVSLSYPAYRVVVGLDDRSRVHFEFLVHAPIAEHLRESGRDETAKIFRYHAEGIQNRVADLLREEFADLWALYDDRQDFAGVFYVPGGEFDSAPRKIAEWTDKRIVWPDK